MATRCISRLVTVALASAATCMVPASLAQDLSARDDFFELSLSELLDIEVTSVSKRSQRVFEAAAAVFVITAEDIRRSGVTSIPEALRMAPGLEVAQVDSNKWAVSARGFQNRFSNKLLVLMDGRTVYSPLFSGVFWDAQDTVIEDIERIEVIRGPGATLWGANAVNGVINIITRSARETSGLLVSAGAGNQERGFTSFRYGAELGRLGHYRVYAKHLDRDENEVFATGEAAADIWRQSRLGFRADLELGESSQLTLQGDGFRGDSGETLIDLSFLPPYRENLSGNAEISGYNLLARWDHTGDAGNVLSVQGFVDRGRRKWTFGELDRTTVDLDVDYRNVNIRNHDLVLGMNYRLNRDEIESTERIAFAPATREEELISAFVQDDWALIDDRLSLVTGIKVELNDYTGYEVQPNLRLLWNPSSHTTWWAAVARAVRTPGRADRDISLLAELEPPSPALPVPTGIYVSGNRDFEAESQISFEAGFKQELSERFAWDLALFRNEYDEVRSFTPAGTQCAPQGELPFCLALPGTFGLAALNQWSNAGSVESHGVELAVTWQAMSRLRVMGAYSYLDLDSDAARDSIPEVSDGDPRQQLSLRLAHQLVRNVDADLWLRFVDEVTVPRTRIESYSTMDLRLAWRPRSGTELSFTGRNLLDASRVQFLSELGDVPEIAIQRSFHLQLRMEF